MDDNTKREIRRIALQNAFEHGAKTRDNTVLSKILGANPDLRGRAAELAPYIAAEVARVNGLSAERQSSEIESDFPEILAKKAPREQRGLPELSGAVQGNVVTRFPPEPNGYPHIGHAKAAIINEAYADKYGGKKILRMDDTNPENERMEYYAAIKVGLDWLGITYDRIKNTSDDMELLTAKGREIIASGAAYVCTCKRDDIGKNRRSMTACKCSRGGAGADMEEWEKMQEKYKPGGACVRFRGGMDSANTVMRDPVLFRIIDARHPLLGDRYRVWPSYDFAVAIEDSIDGVTHAFRSKEYELRDELYAGILDALNMRRPEVISFSRLEFRGMPVSKRVLKPLIERGQIPWYDDPRLPTLAGLQRRGIVPGAVRQFVMSLGLTKADTLAPFDALEAFNRKKIDADTPRLFLVKNPQRMTLDGLPSDTVEIPNHPATDMGKRRIELDGAVYVSADDIAGDGRVRLMGLGDIDVKKTSSGLAGTYAGDEIGAGHPKIQWVPQRGACELRIMVPGPLFEGDSFNEGSLDELLTVAEPHYLQIPDGGLIQFVRFGYCRKESRGMAIYAHR